MHDMRRVTRLTFSDSIKHRLSQAEQICTSDDEGRREKYRTRFRNSPNLQNTYYIAHFNRRWQCYYVVKLASVTGTEEAHEQKMIVTISRVSSACWLLLFVGFISSSIGITVTRLLDSPTIPFPLLPFLSGPWVEEEEGQRLPLPKQNWYDFLFCISCSCCFNFYIFTLFV